MENSTRVARQVLPFDVVTEILVRLPIRTCLRCKCVCKPWYNLIQSSYFIAKHCTENKDADNKGNEFSISCHYCVPNGTSTTVSFRFFDVPIDLTLPIVVDHLEVVGCSNGLICLSLSLLREGFVIWNPVTKKLRHIAGQYPSSDKDKYYNCGFCYNSADNTFKVARIGISGNKIQVNMFISKTNSWSLKELTADREIGYARRIEGVICVGTRLYWDAKLRDDEDRDILCFDMVDESLSFIQLPFFEVGVTQLGSHKRSLALYVCVFTCSMSPAVHFEVWTRNNSNQWSQQIVCTPSVNIACVAGILSKDEINLVVVSNGWCEQFLCDPETGETNKLQWIWNLPFTFCIYSESFASVY